MGKRSIMDNIVEEAARFLARPNKPKAGHYREAAEIVEKHGLTPNADTTS